MINKQGIVHLIRPGAFSQDQYSLLPLQKTFDALVLNASTIVVNPVRAAAFLREFSRPMPYVVDPRTFAFARDPQFVFEKPKSLGRLLSYYGLTREGLPLSPDLSDGFISELTGNVLNYQRTCLGAEHQASFLSPSFPLYPEVLVAPYFLVGGRDDPWFSTNLRFLAEAIRQAGSDKVYAVMLIGKEILSRPDEIVAVTRQYLACQPSGYLIWIEGAQESKLMTHEIRGLRQLVQNLSQSGQNPVFNSYGGYLSALLSHFGLTGFAHSPNGQEKRQVDPPGGGLVEPMYYVPPLHVMRPADAVADYVEHLGILEPIEFAGRICNCQICQEALARGLQGFHDTYVAPTIDMRKLKPSNDYDATTYASLHYLLARHEEIKRVQNSTLRDSIGALVREAAEYRDPTGATAFRTQYLRDWANGLVDRSAEN